MTLNVFTCLLYGNVADDERKYISKVCILIVRIQFFNFHKRSQSASQSYLEIDVIIEHLKVDNNITYYDAKRFYLLTLRKCYR